jgi:hypothetical protein
MYRIGTAEMNANPTNLDALAPPESGSAGETDVGDIVGNGAVISIALGSTVMPSTGGQHNASSASFNLQY